MSAERYIEKLVLADHNVAPDSRSGASSLRRMTRSVEGVPVTAAGTPSTTLPADLKAAVDVGSLLFVRRQH